MTAYGLQSGSTRQGKSNGLQLSDAPGNWLQQHPRLVDLMVAFTIFTYNFPIQLGSLPEGVWPGIGLIISVSLCAPYLWRRRWPLAVFLLIQAVAGVQLALGIGIIAADLMLLLAIYNIASRLAWPVSAGAASVTAAWLVIAAIPALRQDQLNIGDVGVLIGTIIWAWTWGRLVQTRRRYIDGLRRQAEQLAREKEAQATIIAASERARIAREIHDIVSHSLSVVVVMSDGAASKAMTEPERARKAMIAVRDMGRTALSDMRRMLAVLRDGEPGSHAPQPGVDQLDSLVNASYEAGIPVNLTVDGEPVELDSSVDLAVFRIVQEALTNVRKHAGESVSEVSVQVTYRTNDLEVRVCDDGNSVFFPPAGDGHGLVGMKERVSAHGGSLYAGPRETGGFEVLARLPIGGER